MMRRIFVVLVATACCASPASAETLNGALAKAYKNNSSLNSARAAVRITDENIAIAKSGYRPTITGQGSTTYSSAAGTRTTNNAIGISLNQTLFDGFQTRNNVQAAKAQTRAQGQNLRNTEQNTFLNAVSAYMDVIANRQIADLRAKNLTFLNEQVRSAKARFDVGEGTRTDVAQAQASQALAVAELNSAKANVSTSEATYFQVIGDRPSYLKQPKPITRRLPSSLDAALSQAQGAHPAIKATQYAADAAAYQVKSAEGQRLPTITATASAQNTDNEVRPGSFFNSGGNTDTASIGATVTVPIYQAGRVSAQIRQSKETLGQARIDVQATRDNVRAAVVSSWSQYEASKATVVATAESVRAARLALNGVIEERNVGQRTTLDVLDAQAELINTQISQVSSSRDLVVSSYAVLSSVGKLSVGNLGLGVKQHDPEEHYEAVKDLWYGLRTPTGR